jgi:hypothetical protein
MRIRLANWKIKTIKAKIEKINPAPQYQRTSVWNTGKKKLLIDSILRGYDLPKFYLRSTPQDTFYDYEITDGQQRIRAIWEFQEGKYTLDEATIDGVKLKHVSYSDLEERLRNKFDDYELNIAIIEESSPEEIRSLFARLQMGMQLNQVELRHAMNSNIGAAIFSIVESHNFFKDCKIINSRFKHQDYIDHVLTYSFFEGKTDVRAKNIEKLYRDFANADSNVFKSHLLKANRILDIMKAMNDLQKGIFKNKWAFFDVYCLLLNNIDKIDYVNYSEFVSNFKTFEIKRLAHNRNPEELIEDVDSPIYDKNFYEYIMAFNTSGNLQDKIAIRNRVFQHQFIKRGIYLK